MLGPCMNGTGQQVAQLRERYMIMMMMRKRKKGKEMTISSWPLHGEARSSSPIRSGLPGNISNYLPSDKVSHFRMLKS